MKQSHKSSHQLTRRRFLVLALGTVAIPFAGLGAAPTREKNVFLKNRQQPGYPEAALEGRLSARPVSPRPDAPAPAPTGLQRLDLPGEGECFLHCAGFPLGIA